MEGQKHTAGILVHDELYPSNVYSDDATGSIVATCEGFEYAYRKPAEREDNARRLVSCWNACLGIPTEALESGLVRELAEALGCAIGSLRKAAKLVGNENDPYLVSLDKILAKVKPSTEAA